MMALDRRKQQTADGPNLPSAKQDKELSEKNAKEDAAYVESKRKENLDITAVGADEFTDQEIFDAFRCALIKCLQFVGPFRVIIHHGRIE